VKSPRFAAALTALGIALVACINHDYEPCAGKPAGAPCRVCPQNDPSCVETMEVKACDGAGACRGTGTSSTAKIDTRNDGHAWIVDQGGGFCLGSSGVADAPTDGDLWYGGARGVFRVSSRDPGAAYAFDAKPIEAGTVTWLASVRGSTYAELEGTEIVAFDASGGRRSLGKGTAHPIAATANGCVAVKKDEDLSVLVPGASELRSAGLPRPTGGGAPLVDAAVGLDDALLVRAYRAADAAVGVLYRVACPSLAVKELGRGASVANLTDLTRTESGRLFAVDRLNADVRRYRLMQSDDEGVTWTETPVPAGFEAQRIATRGQRVVVAAPKVAAILSSADGGKTFTLDPVDAYAGKDLTVSSVHVSADGVVTMGAECNYLFHRRERLP